MDTSANKTYDRFIDQIYDAYEAELEAKDVRIAELEMGVKNSAETYALQLSAKDKKIAELGAKLTSQDSFKPIVPVYEYRCLVGRAFINGVLIDITSNEYLTAKEAKDLHFCVLDETKRWRK